MVERSVKEAVEKAILTTSDNVVRWDGQELYVMEQVREAGGTKERRRLVTREIAEALKRPPRRI